MSPPQWPQPPLRCPTIVRRSERRADRRISTLDKPGHPITIPTNAVLMRPNPQTSRIFVRS
eukprot:587023-Rhodomonas_salina.2